MYTGVFSRPFVVCGCFVGCSGRPVILTESNGTIAINALDYRNDMTCEWIIQPNEIGVSLF